MNDYLTHRIFSQIICAYVADNVILRISQALFIMSSNCTAYKCSNRNDQDYAMQISTWWNFK